MTADEIKVLEKIFDTKLDPLSKQLTRVETRLENVEDRLEGVEGRLEGVEGRLEGVEGRLGGVEGRLTNVEKELATFKTNTNGTLLIITETLNQLADKEDLAKLDKRVSTLEHQHKN
jgi:archaellum component FlaC